MTSCVAMMFVYIVNIWCLLHIFEFFCLGSCSHATGKLIYYNVDKADVAVCFRRLNATHQIGCGSHRHGNVGVFYYTEDEDALTNLLSKGPDAPYIIALDADLFDRSGRKLIASSSRVNGVVLMPLNKTQQPHSYSPDSHCPNDKYGVYNTDQIYSGCQRLAWNPFGNSLMFENFPFPVIAVVNFTLADILMNQCFLKHNFPGPDGQPLTKQRCGMQIYDVMDGAKDTPTCTRRSRTVTNLRIAESFCEPLGNQNIFSFLRPLQADQKKSIIIVAARYDSFSMFDGHYPGVDSAALSFVTVFAIAEALGRVKEQLNAFTDKHIMLVLFHGEAFDYIGSTRMLFDMRNGKVKFTIDEIEMFVEIGQIGLHAEGLDCETVWMHTGLNPVPQTLQFADLLKTMGASNKLHLTTVGEGQPLPPASFQSFIKARSDLPGVVLTNHQREFTNRFYNSMYDTFSKSGLEYPEPINDNEKYNYVGELARHLQKVSTVISRAVYQFVTGNSSVPDECSSNNVTVANLLYCLTENANCELLTASFSRLIAEQFNAQAMLSRYVGVYSRQSRYAQHVYGVNLFARFLGDLSNSSVTELHCAELADNDRSGYNYIYMQGSEHWPPGCMRTAANYSPARSPAFDIPDYDWSTNLYSSWTESSWQDDNFNSVRIFLIPSYNQEVAVFVVGILVLVLSFAFVYVIQRKASELFAPP